MEVAAGPCFSAPVISAIRAGRSSNRVPVAVVPVAVVPVAFVAVAFVVMTTMLHLKADLRSSGYSGFP
ncbi:hypothetical protein GCM10010519_54800 [Streptomyces lactacystinicus]